MTKSHVLLPRSFAFLQFRWPSAENDRCPVSKPLPDLVAGTHTRPMSEHLQSIAVMTPFVWLLVCKSLAPVNVLSALDGLDVLDDS